MKEREQLEIRVNREYPLLRIPEDFDLYLIHLSETTEKELVKLKQDQPWSKIFAITGAGVMPEEISRVLSGNYYVIFKKDIKYMLNSIGVKITEEKY